jgi:hypothetical protein
MATQQQDLSNLAVANNQKSSRSNRSFTSLAKLIGLGSRLDSFPTGVAGDDDDDEDDAGNEDSDADEETLMWDAQVGLCCDHEVRSTAGIKVQLTHLRLLCLLINRVSPKSDTLSPPSLLTGRRLLVWPWETCLLEDPGCIEMKNAK